VVRSHEHGNELSGPITAADYIEHLCESYFPKENHVLGDHYNTASKIRLKYSTCLIS
jgi:hypothetical protein